jgi:hypothetical protein
MFEMKAEIDITLENYASFYDDDWATQFLDAVERSAVEEGAFNLSFAWFGAARVCSMPRILIDMTEGYHNGFLKHRKPFVRELAEKVSDEIKTRMRGSSIPKTAIGRLTVETRKIADRMAEVRANVEFDRQWLWKSFLSEPQFAIIVVTAQRQSFAAIYFAYEHFLLECYKAKSGDSAARVDREFGKRLKSTYGEAVRDYCWSDPAVNIAKLVRHAIGHAGCSETPDLKKQKHGIPVKDGRLQIMVGHNRLLFNHLKVRALKIAEETV